MVTYDSIRRVARVAPQSTGPGVRLAHGATWSPVLPYTREGLWDMGVARESARDTRFTSWELSTLEGYAYLRTGSPLGI
jgi:hypothetical protein